MIQISISCNFIRNIPDPVDRNKKHYFLFMKAEDVPIGLPIDSDPRPSDNNTQIFKGIYKMVEQSFRNEIGIPNTFHHKNHGLDITAREVIKIDKGKYNIIFDDSDGILNGLHSYNIVIKNKAENPEQFVFWHITTKISHDLVVEMAGGLNTSIQVQQHSLLNSNGEFDWMKDIFVGEPYADKIAYQENEDKDFSITQIIQLAIMFNIDLYPKNSDRFPTAAYSTVTNNMLDYQSNMDSFRKMKNILKDILILYDTIQLTAPSLYRSKAEATVIEERKREPFKFIFKGEESMKRLTLGAAFPILGAFRWFIVTDDDGNYKWNTPNGFEGILNIWDQVSSKLVKTMKISFKDLGQNPNRLGKSSNTWKTLYQELALWSTQQQQ